MSTLAKKIKSNIMEKSTHKYGQLAIFLTLVVINTGCLIEDVVQPAHVGTGSTFTTTVTVSRAGDDSSPHEGAMAVMVPNDWTYASGSYTTTDDVVSGDMIVDGNNGSIWLTQDGVGAVDINTFFTTPTDMQWVFLISDSGSGK